MFDIFSNFVFRGDLGCAREGIYYEWAQVIVDFSYAATQSTLYAASASEMSAEERRAGRRPDKLFLACVVPDRHHHFSLQLLAREGASGAQDEEEEHC